MKQLIIVPDGWQCTFKECRSGLFLQGDYLHLKTEYRSEKKSASGIPLGYYSDAYVCASGEFFMGGASDFKERDLLIVQPVEYQWEDKEE